MVSLKNDVRYIKRSPDRPGPVQADARRKAGDREASDSRAARRRPYVDSDGRGTCVAPDEIDHWIRDRGRRTSIVVRMAVSVDEHTIRERWVRTRRQELHDAADLGKRAAEANLIVPGPRVGLLDCCAKCALRSRRRAQAVPWRGIRGVRGRVYDEDRGCRRSRHA